MPRELSSSDYEADFPRQSDSPEKQTGSGRRREALKHALDIRKFEIELYWKRATYFWTFIAATLAGYSVVQRATDVEVRTDLSVILGLLGFVFSFGWYCVNRGSKQWQENWENHVDFLEDEVIGPLYKTITGRPKVSEPLFTRRGLAKRIERVLVGPGNFSVTKINQLMSLYVTLLFAVLTCYSLPPLRTSAKVNVFYAAAIVLSGLAVVGMLVLGRTADRDHEVAARRREPTIGALPPGPTATSSTKERTE